MKKGKCTDESSGLFEEASSLHGRNFIGLIACIGKKTAAVSRVASRRGEGQCRAISKKTGYTFCAIAIEQAVYSWRIQAQLGRVCNASESAISLISVASANYFGWPGPVIFAGELQYAVLRQHWFYLISFS